MFKTSFKTAAAALLSFTIATTSFTAPAQANGEDVAKVLGGLLLLYGISRALESDDVAVTRQVSPPPRRNHRVIPQRCFREIRRTDGSLARGYGARCMQRHVSRPGLLPARCIRREHTVRGQRNFFRPRCLRREGWTRQARN